MKGSLKSDHGKVYLRPLHQGVVILTSQKYSDSVPKWLKEIDEYIDYLIKPLEVLKFTQRLHKSQFALLLTVSRGRSQLSKQHKTPFLIAICVTHGH